MGLYVNIPFHVDGIFIQHSGVSHALLEKEKGKKQG